MKSKTQRQWLMLVKEEQSLYIRYVLISLAMSGKSSLFFMHILPVFDTFKSMVHAYIPPAAPACGKKKPRNRIVW